MFIYVYYNLICNVENAALYRDKNVPLLVIKSRMYENVHYKDVILYCEEVYIL
jgi:hypothetical protein